MSKLREQCVLAHNTAHRQLIENCLIVHFTTKNQKKTETLHKVHLVLGKHNIPKGNLQVPSTLFVGWLKMSRLDLPQRPQKMP